MGFTKLWSDIVTSSIWSADDKVRIMWITMLATADSTGFVVGSVPGLSDLARMSIEDGRRAIAILESPDQDSRSQEFQGRRIERVNGMGGWVILNYERYRAVRDADAHRDYMRSYMKKRRQQEKTSPR